MAKKPTLTPDEKYALKFLKDLKKNGKPGDVQKRLDRFSPQDRAIFASAIKKTQPASRPAKVNKPAKQAKPVEIKVRGRSTKKLSSFKTGYTSRGSGSMRGGSSGGGMGFPGNLNQ